MFTEKIVFELPSEKGHRSSRAKASCEAACVADFRGFKKGIFCSSENVMR